MPPLGLGGLPGGSGRWTGLVFQFVTWRALSRGLSAFVTVRQVEEALRGRPGIGGSQGRGPGRGVSGEAFPRRWRLSEPWGCSLASASWTESGREPWAKPRSGDRRGRAEEGRRGWSRSAAHGAPPGTGPAGEGGRADRPSQSRSQQNRLSGFFGGVSVSFPCSSAPRRACRPRPRAELLRAFGRSQWWRHPQAWASGTQLQLLGCSFPPGRQDLRGSNGGLVSVPEPCLEVPVG